ncbi:cytochrome c5 family protein [Acidovorax sp. HDW3]|uniref:c-type cytochrome n=1 Tax=Acidovorax sp. HDW3 TaxID=2714923 RepID=UPI00140C0852|nr:c-type cytochrome [Acidovorax sp. HDW3]QIL45176.1 cytochrome c5 family protein [Acidovorax sp. HDW3]
MTAPQQQPNHPGKSPQQVLVTGFFALLIPLLAVAALANSFFGGPAYEKDNATSAKAKAVRLQKVGTVELRDANRPLSTGEQVFKAQCSACHATGAAGSPKLGDAAAWGPRIATGFEALVHSALKGKGAMAPQGGGNFNDTEVARGVAYMANAAGAKFAEPEPPAK